MRQFIVMPEPRLQLMRFVATDLLRDELPFFDQHPCELTRGEGLVPVENKVKAIVRKRHVNRVDVFVRRCVFKDFDG